MNGIPRRILHHQSLLRNYVRNRRHGKSFDTNRLSYEIHSLKDTNMPRFFVRYSGAILIAVLSQLLFISCKRNDLYQKDGSIYLKSDMYWELPKGLISLTYDDGPGPGTVELAKWLYNEHICATFFVVGASDPGGGFKNYPYLDSLIFYGQRIGNHTYNHRDLTQLSCADAKYQIGYNQSFIDPLVNNNLTYFTPPWFEWNKSLSQCMHEDATLDHLRGPVGMTYDTHDYGFRQDESADQCANKFLSDSLNVMKFSRGDGGIIKMHDFNSYTDQYFALQETKIIVQYLKSIGYTFVSPTVEFSPAITNLVRAGEFSDEQHWSTEQFQSMRLADVNGDGKADLICRNAEGVHVALSIGFGFTNEQLWSSEFSDGKGWTTSTCGPIRFADVNGDHKADLIIRGNHGIQVAISNGGGFEPSSLWTNYFSDDSMPQWKEIGYYGTIRAADVNGDGLADIIGRGPEGIFVSLSSSASFLQPTLWTNEYSDRSSIPWKEARYGSTFQLADVNGDGMADLIVRGPNGILVSLSTGNGFQFSSLWSSSFSDLSGWGSDPDYYGAIRVGDVNGDGMADIIARGKDGIHVLLSNGRAFMQDVLWYHSTFSDRAGYKSPYYGSTLQCADINGDHRCDYILRSLDGIGGAVAP
jgi:peptidoglycan/xylan/chitin deacetylase (PgdA/CDA1 family)